MVSRREELQRRLLAVFRTEAGEHLATTAGAIDALAGDAGSEDAIELLFRTVHTLKGAARSVGESSIESVCQAWEKVLRQLMREERPLTPSLLSAFRHASDTLASHMVGTSAALRVDEVVRDLETAALAVDAPEPRSAEPALSPDTPAAPVPPPEATTAPPDDPAREVAREPPRDVRPAPRERAGVETVRIEVGELDRAVVLSENFLIPKLSSTDRANRARRIAVSLDTLLRRTRTDPARAGDAATALRAVEDALRDVQHDMRGLASDLVGDAKSLRMAVDDLFAQMHALRMMPVATVLAAFPAMVRTIARDAGKEVDWAVTGADLAVDRKILDIVKDPLIQLVRNALDHGIEPPEARLAAGKPRRGTVAVRVAPIDGGRIAIEVTDDGRGLSIDLLRAAAIRSRVTLGRDVSTLADDEIIDLAFAAGVSTSAVISDISGHGLGLAIVREHVERIEGGVTVRSEPGRGTHVRLELPTSIATFQGLLVRAGGHSLLWPADSVERALSLPRPEVEAALARGRIAVDGTSLPIGSLAGMLGADRPAVADGDAFQAALVVQAPGSRGVLLVDGVDGHREALIKDLRPPLRRVRGLAAAGLLGSGAVVLILRPADILQSIHRPEPDGVAFDLPDETRRLRVLVVDDSITTRSMERNLFEAAGYAVRTAADGTDAWTMLQTEEIDLVVSDVDMPRMDGFELTERIRGHDKLSNLPVILVTALESREDKERGIEVGANAYVLKSAFDQSNLLDIAGRLV